MHIVFNVRNPVYLKTLTVNPYMNVKNDLHTEVRSYKSVQIVLNVHNR